MRPAALLLAVALALPACTSHSSGRGPGPSPSTTTPVPVPTVSDPPCPAAPVTHPSWPKGVPADMPKPPGLTITSVDRKANITQVRTRVPLSLRESVLFVVKELPKAGFTLTRGDAEATEADAPFVRGDTLRGLVRILATGERCETIWLFAVTRHVS